MWAPEFAVGHFTRKRAMNRPVCKAESMEGATFCHQCGAKLSGAASEKSPRERMAGAAGGKRDSDVPERELWQGSYSKLDMVGAWAGAGLFTIVLLLWAMLGGF